MVLERVFNAKWVVKSNRFGFFCHDVRHELRCSCLSSSYGGTENVWENVTRRISTAPWSMATQLPCGFVMGTALVVHLVPWIRKETIAEVSTLQQRTCGCPQPGSQKRPVASRCGGRPFLPNVHLGRARLLLMRNTPRGAGGGWGGGGRAQSKRAHRFPSAAGMRQLRAH